MHKVFALSSGSYSDYRVSMLFASREEADATLAKLDPRGHGDWYVEEFDFIPEGASAPMRVVYEAAWSSRKTDVVVSDRIELGTAEAFHHAAHRYESYAGDGSYQVVARGTDRERVMKSVSDKRAECLARDEGIS